MEFEVVLKLDGLLHIIHCKVSSTLGKKKCLMALKGDNVFQVQPLKDKLKEDGVIYVL